MRRRERGSVFMMAVIGTLIVSLIMVTLAVRLTGHIRSETLRLDQRAARQVAAAGLARGLASLEQASVNALLDTDEWYSIGEQGQESFGFGSGKFRLQVIDAGSFVNLNTVNEEQLANLNLTSEQVDALLDWRSEEFVPRPLGAKDEFYNALENPYNTRLQPFTSVSELFLVKGFLPEEVLNPPTNVSGNLLTQGNVEDTPPLFDLLTVDSSCPNTRADGTARTNINTSSLQQLVQGGLGQQAAQAIVTRRNTVGTFTGMGQVMTVGGLSSQDAQVLLDNFTATNETTLTGRINLNTASEAVLRSVPNITEDQVQAIFSRQGAFASLGELATVAGFSNAELGEVADLFTVGSTTFLVRVEGQQNFSRSLIEAVVVVTEGVPKVVKVYYPTLPETTERWGWPAETSFETVLMDKE